MPYLPKPLMRCDQTLRDAALLPGREGGGPIDHEFQHIEQIRGDFYFALVASVVEGDEDFVRQAPSVAWFGHKIEFGRVSRFLRMLLIHASPPTSFVGGRQRRHRLSE
jgi:hypothetical protein